MTSWFDDPKQLIRSDKVLDFWPSTALTPEERVNATARFIIYATCIIYLIKRDTRIFVIGGTALGVLFIMERSDMVKEALARPTDGQLGATGACQLPNEDNPMGNVLLSDFKDRPDRPSACYYPTVKKKADDLTTNGVKYGPARSRSAMPIYQRNAMSRQFVTMPSTSLAGDPYYEYIHGKKGQNTCRQDPRLCNPNARGVQLEAFAGLAPSGDIRNSASRPAGTFSP